MRVRRGFGSGRTSIILLAFSLAAPAAAQDGAPRPDSLASSRALPGEQGSSAGPAHHEPRAYFEISPTVFRPRLALEDRVSIGEGSVRWFSTPEASYSGFYLGGGSTGRIGVRGGFGMGRERSRVFADGGAISIGPVPLLSLWVHFDLGLVLRASLGPLDVAPSLGLGCLFSALTMEEKKLNLSDEASGVHPFTSGELAVRLWFGHGFGITGSYHRLMPWFDPTFGFSDDDVKLDGTFGDVEEIRAGICIR